MIELAFIANNREIILYRIQDKVITYLDRIWKNGLQIIPINEQFEALKKSHSPFARTYAKLIEEANTGRNLEEWQAAKNDEELAEIIRKDAAFNGLIEVKK